jgi:hypothetical protein
MPYPLSGLNYKLDYYELDFATQCNKLECLSLAKYFQIDFATQCNKLECLTLENVSTFVS